jgi:anti-sigma factor (TIGR02949 family)
MIDDCADVRFRLMLLRRGELDPREAGSIRRHLESCPECAAELDAERELDRRLRHDALVGAAPADLRAAVAALAARERGPRWRAWTRSLGARARRPLVAAALGALAALLVAVPSALLWPRPRPAENPLAAPLAEAVAGYQRILLQRDITGFESGDAERIVAELKRLHGLPTTTAFRGDAEMQLLAVHPTYALGHAGALFVFGDRAGRLVILQIVRAPEVRIPREATTPVAAFRPVLARRDSVAVALWKQADALYALSAPTDEAELSRIFLKVRQGTTNPP